MELTVEKLESIINHVHQGIHSRTRAELAQSILDNIQQYLVPSTISTTNILEATADPRLSKREQFAITASSDVPKWFVHEAYPDKPDLKGDLSVIREWNSHDMMYREVQWRYYYAEIMLQYSEEYSGEGFMMYRQVKMLCDYLGVVITEEHGMLTLSKDEG